MSNASKQLKEYPKNIKPYKCHGSDIEKIDTNEWVCTCYSCGKKNHMYVNSETGQFNCKVCDHSGNIVTFLTDFASEIVNNTTRTNYKKLSDSRGTTTIGKKTYSINLPSRLFKSFGVGYDANKRVWIIPVRGDTKKVRDIRRYTSAKQMMATAGITLQLGGCDRIKRAKRTGTLWLCEGEWDAIVMQHLINLSGRKTLDSVCWVPGASVFKDDWAKYFKGKNVVCVYDNDDAGDRGAEKAYKVLNGKCASVKFVNWPDTKPKGFDLRDYIIRNLSLEKEPTKVYDELAEVIEAAPRHMDVKPIEQASQEKADEEDLEIASYQELEDTFSKYVKMNNDMRGALRVSLAVCLSNMMKSDPLWMYIIGPPGSGKTLILSALQDSARCHFVSTITAHSLISGWQMQGGEDPSLIPKLIGKTFVAKDFTEILTMPQMMQEEIFSTLRGAYDGYVQKPFGNGVNREYKDCYFSMLAGVTHAVHGHDKASLGERFLKYQMNHPSQRQANEIIMAAMDNVGSEKKMEGELQIIAKRFLARKVDLENLPTISVEFKERIMALVQLIAVLRANVARNFKGDEIVYRPVAEFGTRLAKQLVKLAMMLAVVEDKDEVDNRVFLLVERVAKDTAYGFNFDIIEAMVELGGTASRNEIADYISMPSSTLYRKFEDMQLLKAIRKVEGVVSRNKEGRKATMYEVVPKVAELWKKAKGIKEVANV